MKFLRNHNRDTEPPRTMHDRCAVYPRIGGDKQKLKERAAALRLLCKQLERRA